MIFGQYALENCHSQSCIVLHEITLLLKCVLNGIINKDKKYEVLKISGFVRMGALFMKEGKYSRTPLTQTLMGNEKQFKLQ